jgi:hypothetical protein
VVISPAEAAEVARVAAAKAVVARIFKGGSGGWRRPNRPTVGSRAGVRKGPDSRDLPSHLSAGSARMPDHEFGQGSVKTA